MSMLVGKKMVSFLYTREKEISIVVIEVSVSPSCIEKTASSPL